jgi:hypothetical protein
MVKLRVLRIEISNQLQYIRWWKILFCNELYMVRIDISEALKFHVEKEEYEAKRWSLLNHREGLLTNFIGVSVFF